MFLTPGLEKKKSRKKSVEPQKLLFTYNNTKEPFTYHDAGRKTAPRRKTPFAAILNACDSLPGHVGNGRYFIYGNYIIITIYEVPTGNSLR